MWQYTPETEEYWQGVAKNLGTPEPEAIVFDADKPVSDEQGRAIAEALNVHEQTGLTPAQLQARVADLEGALAAERERICAAIKAEDDYCVTEGGYMLDSDDCVKIVREVWVRPDYSVGPHP